MVERQEKKKATIGSKMEWFVEWKTVEVAGAGVDKADSNDLTVAEQVKDYMSPGSARVSEAGFRPIGNRITALPSHQFTAANSTSSLTMLVMTLAGYIRAHLESIEQTAHILY